MIPDTTAIWMLPEDNLLSLLHLDRALLSLHGSYKACHATLAVNDSLPSFNIR
jgi:hypothetical protein